MIPAALRRSIEARTAEDIHNGIPKDFTLNKGHVTFFYDKLKFLIKRFNKLADEMERRGYSPDRTRIEAFDGFDKQWYGDWESSNKDDEIVLERINFRISQKPHLYED